MRGVRIDRVEVRSGGSGPADRVNPVAVEAMAEVGIDISRGVPERMTPDAVRAGDLVVTMGCGDACPMFAGMRFDDWELDDPAGLDLDRVRPVRSATRSATGCADCSPPSASAERPPVDRRSPGRMTVG